MMFAGKSGNGVATSGFVKLDFTAHSSKRSTILIKGKN